MRHKVTLIPGEGIGPEVASATRRVLEAVGVQIDWQEMEAWEKITVPALTSAIERATGKWRPTNRWELVFR